MTKNTFSKNKKIWIVAVFEWIVGGIVIGLIANYAYDISLRTRREKAEANAMTYSERIDENLMNDSIQSIQLAPGEQ